MSVRRRQFDTYVATIGVLVALATAPTASAADKSASDSINGARAAFMAYDDGWRTGKADEIVDAFAPDFEWTNSVGIRITDKTMFRRFLDRLFQDPNYLAGKPGPLNIRSLSLLGDDIAVISSSGSTFGQKDYKTGKAVPEQRTNELTVLRRIDQRWLIVSDLTSDEANGI